jgi:hypothetical protein
MSPLMMGRAAAVRAQTKGKTDAAKAKLNARYGKMISMGASPPLVMSVICCTIHIWLIMRACVHVRVK